MCKNLAFAKRADQTDQCVPPINLIRLREWAILQPEFHTVQEDTHGNGYPRKHQLQHP